MFKMAKYFFIYTLYKRVKINVIAMIAALFLLMVMLYIMNDIVSVADRGTRYTVLLIKWLMSVALLSIMVYNLTKIIKAISMPFKNKTIKKVDPKKERVLNKEHLRTQSEQIIQKYQSRTV